MNAFTVNSFVDAVDATLGDGICATTQGVCTLRAAIQEANTVAGTDTINIPTGTYILSLAGRWEDNTTSGDLDITDNLVITGEGATNTIIDANGLDRILHVIGPITATISDVTFRNGNPGSGVFGGAILNQGVLTLTNSIVKDNIGSGGGGGISNGGTLVVLNSNILNNTADTGAGGIASFGPLTLHNSSIFSNTGSNGISNDIGDVLTLTNCTVSSNIGNGVRNNGIVNINNCTVTNNTGEGLAHSGGTTANIKNTILAGNSSSDCSGTLTSQGYNIIQNTTGCIVTTTNNIIGLDPNLGPLQDNGGPSLTHALLSGSPAINAGNPTTPGSGGNACETTDQRGINRQKNGRCDIGAYEAIAIFLPLILKTL